MFPKQKDVITSFEQKEGIKINNYALYQNVPNPFNAIKKTNSQYGKMSWSL
mgnify:CR=1 FL=1